MRKVANTSEPPVVVPVVVVAVDVHVPLAVPPVERGDRFCMKCPLDHHLLNTLKVVSNLASKCPSVSYQVFSFFVEVLHTPPYPKP